MYTDADEREARGLFSRRLRLAIAPSALIVAAGVAVFVLGRMRRSNTLWMLTAALTVLGGGLFLFLLGVWVKPVLDYRRHVERMLHGRSREVEGVLTSFSAETCEREGVTCHAMMLNLGCGEPEDDRLFYYDDEKPLPDMPVGTRVRVRSSGNMVCGLWGV